MSPLSPTATATDGRQQQQQRRGAARGRPHARLHDAAVRAAAIACGVVVVCATGALGAFLARAGLRGVREVGIGALVAGETWKPEAGAFGGRALVLGTAATALGALLAGALPALLAAVWLVELAPRGLRRGYRRVMEMAAAVPSVVYGWLALVHLVPAMASLARALYGADAEVGGEGLAASTVLLSIMIAPTVMLLASDALARVPFAHREASAALGASRLQTAFRVTMPSAWRGLVVAVFFGFARAAGETMAVQMVIGGARRVPDNPFQPTTTISTQIVMDMQNAAPDTPASDALFSMALVLLVVSVAVVLFTRALGARARRGSA